MAMAIFLAMRTGSAAISLPYADRLVKDMWVRSFTYGHPPAFVCIGADSIHTFRCPSE
jgi:hypothetical protein